MLARSALIAASLPLLGGCTLIGAAAGAVTPAYDTATPPYGKIEPGTEVRIVSAPTKTTRELDGALPRPREYGRWVGIDDGIITLQTDDPPPRDRRSIQASTVETVELRNGSYVRTGVFVGVILDVIVVTSIAVAVANTHYSPLLARFAPSSNSWSMGRIE